MLDGWLMSPTLVCAPKLIGHKRCPCGTVDGTALGLTPSEKGLDVNIDPPGGNTCQRHLWQSLLGAGKPLVVGVIELVAIRCELSETRPLFSPVPCEPSDEVIRAHVSLMIRLTSIRPSPRITGFLASGRGHRAPAPQPSDVRRALLPRQPSDTETHGQPAPIFPLAIEKILLEVCGRNTRDEVSQLRYRSLCLVSLARQAV
jgi:hypothetical protein